MEGQDSRARVRAHSHGNLNNNGRPPLLPVGGATTTVTTGVLPANHNSKDTTSKHQHFKLYKPAKVLTQFVFTHRTRKKRTLLGDVLRGTATCTADSSEPVPIPLKWPMGTMAIGRLDEDSEGLLLLTTDGTVSERVRRTSVEKEYWVQLDGQITEQALHRLCHGVPISLPTGPKCDKDQGDRSTYTYTTLPCQARVLDTVVVRVNSTSTTAKAKNPSAGPVAVSKRKRKRNFGGICNTCGKTGHKAKDCDQNPVDVSNVTTTKILNAKSVRVPPGIAPPSSNLHIRDESSRHGPTSWISITIHEGKNRQVRRMTAAVGFPTLRLIRVRIGSIALDGMVAGDVREIAEELEKLE